MAAARAARLVSVIEEAFSEVEYPGDERLVYDSSGKHLECAEVAAALRGRDWRELSVEELRYSPSNLFFMTPEAVHYYLPAYLRASVVSYGEAGGIPDTLLWLLNDPGNSSHDPQVAGLLRRLTAAQRAAIRSFLEFLRDEHGADFPMDDLSPSAVLEAWR